MGLCTANARRPTVDSRRRGATISCCVADLNKVIYRLTVQTLPDGLETQFTPPDTTQTAPSCRVWQAV